MVLNIHSPVQQAYSPSALPHPAATAGKWCSGSFVNSSQFVCPVLSEHARVYLTLSEDGGGGGGGGGLGTLRSLGLEEKCGRMSRVMQRGVGDISGLFLKACDKTTCLGSHNCLTAYVT